MTELILCRHGRTDWNDIGRYQGQTDVPLNAEGWRQARFLSQTLRNEQMSVIIASDLARAADTAAEIARFHNQPVRRDARLREIDQGRWEGLTVPEIRERDVAIHDRWVSEPLSVTLPGGESIGDIQRRVLGAVREYVEEYRGGLLCLVTHKVVMTIIRCDLTGDPLEPALRHLPANASFERIEVPEGYSRR